MFGGIFVFTVQPRLASPGLLHIKNIKEWAMRTNCIKKTSHNSSNSLIRKEIRRIVWGFERSKIAPQACFGLGGIPNPSRGMPRNDVIRHCGLGRKTGVRNYITTVDRLKALRWPKMALANAFLMQMMRNI